MKGKQLAAVLFAVGIAFGGLTAEAAEKPDAKPVKNDIGERVDAKKAKADEKVQNTDAEKAEAGGKKENDAKAEEKLGKTEEKLSLQERIQAILHPEKNAAQAGPIAPVTYEPDDIFGTAQATQEQCVRFLLENNPKPSIACSAKELVGYYYEEAGKEGIRPDVAFVQAIKETGFFGYGGTVIPEQNNYCGLGTTSATVQGGYFPSPQIGVRAHIQHLLAYASARKPKEAVVDPRYELVRDMYGDNVLTKWTMLNGRWAVPGTYYGESILEIFGQLLEIPEK